VTVGAGWDPGVVPTELEGAVSAELEGVLSSELDGVVSGLSVVLGGTSATLAHATAPSAPTARAAVMMPMSLRFMVASFVAIASVFASIGQA
jgi:hypothetical protein